MNNLDTRDPLERILRDALHADAERAPQLPSEWIGLTTSSVTDDRMVEDDPRVGWRPLEQLPPERHPRQRWMLVAAATIVVLAIGLLALAAVQDPDSVQTDTVPPTRAASTNPATTSPSLPDVASPPITAAPTDDEQIATVTPTPTTAAPVQPDMVTRFVDPDGDDATALRVTYQVPTNSTEWWSLGGGSGLGDGFGTYKYLPGTGITALSITTVSNLVSDGCRDHTPLDPPVGPTVNDLATALSQLAPFEVTAPPTDVTLFGYHGKHLELTVPAMTVTSGTKNDAKFIDCVEGELHSWISPLNGPGGSPTLLGHSHDSLGAFNAYQRSGQTEEFWILDVHGTRVVFVNFDTLGAPAADIATRDAIFESIRIEP